MPDISKIKLKGITYDIKDTEARNGISNINTITQARVDEITDYTPASFPSPVYAYETVADMQADKDLQEGMIVHTNGFHTAGDGGAAYYRVTSADTANGMDVLMLQGELKAALIVDSCINIMQLGASTAAADNTAIINRAFELADIVDLNGDEFAFVDSIIISRGKELINGSIRLADTKQLCISNLVSVHDIIFIVDNCATDGVVFISNAYTVDNDSCVKNIFDSNTFKVTNSPDVVLIKVASYNASSSPTGNIGSPGLFGWTITNTNVATNELYGIFLKCQSNGGWITSSYVENCWFARAKYGFYATNTSTISPNNLGHIYLSQVRGQYATGVEGAAHVATGRFVFDSVFVYDLPTSKHQVYIEKGHTNVGIGVTNLTYGNGYDYAAQLNENDEYVSGAAFVTNSTPFDLLQGMPIFEHIYRQDNYTPSVLPQATSHTGYSFPRVVHRINISGLGHSGFIGRQYIAGNAIAPNAYISGALGISYYNENSSPIFIQQLADGTFNYAPILCGLSGPYASTGNRPTYATNGACIFDINLKKPIWFYDGKWYTADGTDVTA